MARKAKQMELTSCDNGTERRISALPSALGITQRCPRCSLTNHSHRCHADETKCSSIKIDGANKVVHGVCSSHLTTFLPGVGELGRNKGRKEEKTVRIGFNGKSQRRTQRFPTHGCWLLRCWGGGQVLPLIRYAI